MGAPDDRKPKKKKLVTNPTAYGDFAGSPGIQKRQQLNLNEFYQSDEDDVAPNTSVEFASDAK